MNIEYEATFVNINKDKIRKKYLPNKYYGKLFRKNNGKKSF